MELKDLVGDKKLDAVDLYDEKGIFEDSQIVKFRLDDIVYCAIEDPDDGYRSSMKELVILPKDNVSNVFPAIDVLCVYNDYPDLDLLTIFDAETNEVVLEVGTDNTDDYYPFFVGSFFPEAMCTNKK